MGVVFVAFGVSICSKANLGVSMIAAPAFVISEALMPIWSALNVGVTEYIFQGVLLVLLCSIVRRFNWRYLLAFAVAVFFNFSPIYSVVIAGVLGVLFTKLGVRGK